MTTTTTNNNGQNLAFALAFDGELPYYCDPNKNTFEKKLTPKKTKIEARRGAELSNYLQNTLATVSDRKYYVYQNKLLQYGQAEVVTSQDYYPFGMEMMGSSDLYNPTNTDEYSGRVYHNKSLTDRNFRYGFNGKEKDDAFHDNITNYDYGFRIYNPGISRFLSVDPLTRDYPMLTPYQFASNTPIRAIDVDGLEAMYVEGREFLTATGEIFTITREDLNQQDFDRRQKYGSDGVLYNFTDVDGNTTEYYFAGAVVTPSRTDRIIDLVKDVGTAPSRALGGYVQRNHPAPNEFGLELNIQASGKGVSIGGSIFAASDGIRYGYNSGGEISSNNTPGLSISLNLFKSSDGEKLKISDFKGPEANLSFDVPTPFGLNAGANYIKGGKYDGIGLKVGSLNAPSISGGGTDTTIPDNDNKQPIKP